MDAAGYRVVYDVTESLPDWQFPAFGLLFVVISGTVWRFRHQLAWAWHGPARTRPGWRNASAGFMFGFSVLWTAIASFGVFGEHFKVRSILKKGEASVVQGPVQDFHPMPYGGHDTERFVVGGVLFAYSDYGVVAGFHQTSSHGGPIAPGLMVRIHYSGDPGRLRILKLEIKEDEVCR